MGKKRDLTDFERGMIVGARMHGASINETAVFVQCSRAAVVKVCQDWKLRQKTVSERANCGRHRVVNKRAERRISRNVKQNRTVTVQKIAADLNDGSSQRFSERTVRRAMHRMGYKSRRPVRTPLLSAANKKKRLKFAQAHKDWTVDYWKQVMWSDESRFQMHHADGRVRVWRKQHESMDPKCIATTLQAGGGNVIVWGMFSWHSLGPLIRVHGRQNKTSYLNIVADQVHPVMLMIYPNGNGYFQQDNATCHTADIVKDWFAEHDRDFTLLPWPPQSPDLNPIEHLWDEVERVIRHLDPPPSNLTLLNSALLQAWSQIPQKTYQHLVESMPRRIKAVIKAKGGPTTY